MPMEPNTGEAWKPGQEVIGVYDFRGTTSEDLPFVKGDVLVIVKSTRDVNWYKASNKNGKEGMIPATYVQGRKEVSLQAMPWFHGRISRDKADELLNPRKNGLFLVRESVNFPGDYTLSVCCGNKVEHYRIIYSSNKLTIDEEGYFDNLSQLVEHYTKDADGLCTRLVQPLSKQGESYFSVSAEEFRTGGWTINLSDIQLGEPLGKGEFGDVLRGLYQGQTVAIKKLKDNNRAAQAFLREASLMTSVRHNNLVALIGIVSGETIYLVLEFMGKGNLVEYLRSRGRSVITKKDQINFATDTCSAMAYLESRKLVHRDLAARNVLVNDEGTAKVSDFGLASFTDFNPSGGKFPIKWTAPESLRDNVSDFGLASFSDFTPSSGRFPVKWTAPEALRQNDGLSWYTSEVLDIGDEPKLERWRLLVMGDRWVTDGMYTLKLKFTSKSDMWSFGILLWEIYSFGRVPYPRIPLADVVQHVERGYRMEAPEGSPPEIYTVMTDAWQKDPNTRPTFQSVLEKLHSQQSVTV